MDTKMLGCMVATMVMVGCGPSSNGSASSSTSSSSASAKARASASAGENARFGRAVFECRRGLDADLGDCVPQKAPCNGEAKMESGGKERTYRFHIPKAKGGKPGLVIALHGKGGKPKGFEATTHFDKIANEDHFVVIYPAGFDETWAGPTGNSAADKAGVDDVAFISALIDRATGEMGVDPGRVVIAGFSAGGFMAQRIGCELTNKINAIGTASGTMAKDQKCAPSKPISVIMFHGDADDHVPFAGGEGKDGAPLLGAKDVVAKWAAFNKCSPTPTSTTEPDVDPDDGTTAGATHLLGLRERRPDGAFRDSRRYPRVARRARREEGQGEGGFPRYRRKPPDLESDVRR